MRTESRAIALLVGIVLLVVLANALQAAAVYIPNASFESPTVPDISPWATPTITDWQKAPMPDWWPGTGYTEEDWYNTAGVFLNVSDPNLHIDNCDANQAAFLFATPGVELFQDLAAVFEVGQSYHLTVGLIGGGYGMPLDTPIELRLYYRDDTGNRITVGTTIVTNTNNTGRLLHLTDYQLDIPTVTVGDAWAGENIGVQLISTVGAGGYWVLDNVRLTSVPEPASLAIMTLGGAAFFLRRRR